MPTYKNKGLREIYLEHDNTFIRPGEVKEVLSFYRNPDLELIDVNPYLNPVKISEFVTISGSSYTTYDVYNAYKIEIANYDEDIMLKFNDSSDTRYMIIRKGHIFEFTNRLNRIDKIFLKCLDSSKTSKVHITLFSKELVELM